MGACRARRPRLRAREASRPVVTRRTSVGSSPVSASSGSRVVEHQRDGPAGRAIGGQTSRRRRAAGRRPGAGAGAGAGAPERRPGPGPGPAPRHSLRVRAHPARPRRMPRGPTPVREAQRLADVLRLRQQLAVDVDVAVDEREGLPAEADDALHVRDAVPLEREDPPALRHARAARLDDDDAVAGQQRGDHAARDGITKTSARKARTTRNTTTAASSHGPSCRTNRLQSIAGPGREDHRRAPAIDPSQVVPEGTLAARRPSAASAVQVGEVRRDVGGDACPVLRDPARPPPRRRPSRAKRLAGSGADPASASGRRARVAGESSRPSVDSWRARHPCSPPPRSGRSRARWCRSTWRLPSWPASSLGEHRAQDAAASRGRRAAPCAGRRARRRSLAGLRSLSPLPQGHHGHGQDEDDERPG